MNPQVLTVSKVSQGSNYPDKPWSKARFSFMKQLAIRFGKLDPTKILDPAIPNLQYNGGNKIVERFSSQILNDKSVLMGQLAVVIHRSL